MVMFGLVGGPLALLAGIGALLGAWEKEAVVPVVMTVPEVVWEFSLSVWLLFRGFRPSPILTGPPLSGAPDAPLPGPAVSGHLR